MGRKKRKKFAKRVLKKGFLLLTRPPKLFYFFFKFLTTKLLNKLRPSLYVGSDQRLRRLSLRNKTKALSISVNRRFLYLRLGYRIKKKKNPENLKEKEGKLLEKALT